MLTGDGAAARSRDRRASSTAAILPPPMPAVTTSVLDRVRDTRGAARGLLRGQPAIRVLQPARRARRLRRRDGPSARPRSRRHGRAGAGRSNGSRQRARSSVCDLVMSGVAVTADRALHVQFSASYLDETVAFVVPDNLRSAFSEWASVRAMGRLRLAVPRAPYYIQKIREELTDVEIVPIDRMDDMFVPHAPADRRRSSLTAERGSAYTLLHPGVLGGRAEASAVQGSAGVCDRRPRQRHGGHGQHVDRAQTEGRHDRRIVRALDSRTGRGAEAAAVVHRRRRVALGPVKAHTPNKAVRRSPHRRPFLIPVRFVLYDSSHSGFPVYRMITPRQRCHG